MLDARACCAFPTTHCCYPLTPCHDDPPLVPADPHHPHQVAASYDLQHWFRVPSTSFDQEQGVLHWSLTAEADAVHFAYFAPYTADRHAALLGRMQTRPAVKLQTLGHTLDGHNLDMLVVGEPGPGKRAIWLVARQHPGETMAEWFMVSVNDYVMICDPRVHLLVCHGWASQLDREV